VSLRLSEDNNSCKSSNDRLMFTHSEKTPKTLKKLEKRFITCYLSWVLYERALTYDLSSPGYQKKTSGSSKFQKSRRKFMSLQFGELAMNYQLFCIGMERLISILLIWKRLLSKWNDFSISDNKNQEIYLKKIWKSNQKRTKNPKKSDSSFKNRFSSAIYQRGKWK